MRIESWRYKSLQSSHSTTLSFLIWGNGGLGLNGINSGINCFFPKWKQTKYAKRLSMVCIIQGLITPHIWRSYKNIVSNNLSSRIRQPQVQILASLSIICVICSNTLSSLNLTFLICAMRIINAPVSCDDLVSISSYVFMELAKCFRHTVCKRSSAIAISTYLVVYSGDRCLIFLFFQFSFFIFPSPNSCLPFTEYLLIF